MTDLHLDVYAVDFDNNFNIVARRNIINVKADVIVRKDLSYLNEGTVVGDFEKVYLPMTFTKVLVLYGARLNNLEPTEHIPTHQTIWSINFGCQDFDVITMDEYKKIPGSTYD